MGGGQHHRTGAGAQITVRLARVRWALDPWVRWARCLSFSLGFPTRQQADFQLSKGPQTLGVWSLSLPRGSYCCEHKYQVMQGFSPGRPPGTWLSQYLESWGKCCTVHHEHSQLGGESEGSDHLPLLQGEGWYREQGRSLPSVHKARLPTEGGATKLLGKEREKGVLACPMPLQMLSSLLSSSSTLQQVLILQDAVLRSLP